VLEVRITYPFHPRCGESVPVFRRFAYRGVDLVVIPQPDGSIACIPEWMTHEQATHLTLSAEPCFQLEILRTMRAEVDALLAFLPSESPREKNAHETQSRKSRPAKGLFDLDEPSVVLAQVKTAQLVMLVETLLIEIAVALAAGEASDEQDNR
jgi:hypothetical protein